MSLRIVCHVSKKYIMEILSAMHFKFKICKTIESNLFSEPDLMQFDAPSTNVSKTIISGSHIIMSSAHTNLRTYIWMR